MVIDTSAIVAIALNEPEERDAARPHGLAHSNDAALSGSPPAYLA